MIGNVFCHVLKIIRFVFLTFVDNLLAFSQVEKLWSWSLRWEVSTSRSLYMFKKYNKYIWKHCAKSNKGHKGIDAR